MTSTDRTDSWAIIGGGILGMTLAARLAEQHKEVTLFEGADHLGGLASAWALGDIVWDRHYHVTLFSDRHTRALLAELDLDGELEWVTTRTGFYTNGQLVSLSNALEFLRFPPLSFVDKARLALTILYASRIRNWRRLESVPVATWLRRWSGERTFDRIWLPLLRSKLGDNYERTSAAFIWATIARMYAARRTGLKREMFGYVNGGYARILERFGQDLLRRHVNVQLGRAVRHVQADRDGALAVELADGTRHRFESVVITAPAPVVPRICPTLTDDEKAQFGGVCYQGIVCASVLLRHELSPFYITNITDSGLPFTAVIEMSALVDRRHFGGKALVYLPKYVDPDDPVFARSDAEIEDVFLSGLERMFVNFRRSDVLAFRVSRAKHVYALPTLGYSSRLPPVHTSVPGLHVVNSAHIVNGTLNVNETVGLAERMLPELLASSRSRSVEDHRVAVTA